MKLKIIPVLALLTLSLWIASCAPATSIDISCDDFGAQEHISKKVTTAVGDSFTVTLCSNATTGFQWSETAQISNHSVLEQVDYGFTPPEAGGDKPAAPGTPGEEVWTFKAIEAGTAEVSMEYSRPWEGGEKGEWTFDLTVIVE